MLLAPEVMRQVVLLRKMLSAVGQIEGTELLLDVPSGSGRREHVAESEESRGLLD